MLRKQLFTIALCFGFSVAFSQEVCRPQTMDELLTVIDKFTNEDPDGDGENNTYGIGVAGSPNVFGGGYGGQPF